MGYAILDFFDFISNSILMPIVALLTCFFAGYVLKPSTIIMEVEENGEVFGRKKIYGALIKYVAPICLILILITSILTALGIINI